MWRGDVVPVEATTALSALKAHRTLRFVDWSYFYNVPVDRSDFACRNRVPTGFKCSFNYSPPTQVPGSDLAPTSRAVCALSNSTAMAQVFDRILRKFDTLLAKRTFGLRYAGV